MEFKKITNLKKDTITTKIKNAVRPLFRVKRRHTLQLEHKNKYMPCLILQKIKQSLQTFLILNGKITNALLFRGKSLFKRLKKYKMVKLTFSPPIRPVQKIYPPPPELQGFLRQIFALVAAA